jgi:DNA repair exonuclease SbcCD nuclease subunit
LVKFIITGDNHLNLYNQKLGSRLAERRRRIGQAWWKTIEYAIKHKADIYINTGDLFDQLSPRNPPRARVVEAFKSLKDNGIEAYIAAGNHEAPASERDGASPHTILGEAGLANVFESYTDFQQYKQRIGKVNVSIAGMSYNRNLASKDDPLEGKTIPAGADLNIAVLHYSVEEIAPPIWEEPVVKVESIKQNPQIQVFAMGHIHGHVSTKINDSYVIYPGGTEHYDFGEWEQETGFVVIDYNGKNIKIEYIPVSSQPMRQLKLHTSNLKHDQLTGSINEAVSKDSNKEGLLQLILEGEISFRKYTEIDFTTISQKGSEQNFYFELIDRIKPLGEGLEFSAGEGLNPRNRLEEAALEAIDKAANEHEQKIWQQAMNYAVEYYLKEQDK